MRIKKIATSVGVLGKILNSKNSSNQDTYSCDYLNNKFDTVVQEDISSKKTSNVSTVTRAIVTQDKNIYHIDIVCAISNSGAIFSTNLRPLFTTGLNAVTSKGKSVRCVFSTNGNIELASLSEYPDDIYINGIVIIPSSQVSSISEEPIDGNISQ